MAGMAFSKIDDVHSTQSPLPAQQQKMHGG
jgi:hypothetical protein